MFCGFGCLGFYMYQDGGPNVEFCFFSLEERGFKSIMPIWLSCFWIFGKVVKRVFGKVVKRDSWLNVVILDSSMGPFIANWTCPVF